MSLDKKNNVRKGIVILGAGIMQIPAIEAAAEKGFTTIVFDGNINASGRNKADFFEVIDLKNMDAIYSRCISYRKTIDISGVFTAGTDFSYVVAWLSEKLSLPGISYETALRATDKSRMRAAFAENNVPSPKFAVAEKDMSGDLPVEELGFPLVVKPVDSMGARGTVKAFDSGSLEKAIENALVHSRSGKAIIEQYIEGPEFSLDALVKNGEIHVCGIADRHIFFPPYFIEMGHTMPSAYSRDIQKSVIDVFCRGIKAIGIDNGAAKGDIKYSGNGAVAGEIAARLSGGYMSGWTFPYSTGFSVIGAAIDIATGVDPGKIEYSYTGTSAERAFISIPGVVESVIVPEYLGGLPSEQQESCVKDLFINVKTGDAVNFPKNNVEKCGNVIAFHPKRDEAAGWAEKACRDIIVRLKPGEKSTFDFFFREKEEWIPDAFDEKCFSDPDMKDIYNISENNKDIITRQYPAITVLLPRGKGLENGKAGKDWQGRSMEYAMKQISGITGIKYADNIPDDGSITLGRAFWRCFSRGSVQGGIWIVDTVSEYIKKGKKPDIFRC